VRLALARDEELQAAAVAVAAVRPQLRGVQVVLAEPPLLDVLSRTAAPLEI